MANSRNLLIFALLKQGIKGCVLQEAWRHLYRIENSRTLVEYKNLAFQNYTNFYKNFIHKHRHSSARPAGRTSYFIGAPLFDSC